MESGEEIMESGNGVGSWSLEMGWLESGTSGVMNGGVVREGVESGESGKG